jgi:23S rRNA (adenine2503-C2)-methyltransferase
MVMDIIKNIVVPTGNICISNGELGLVEFLSIGDYGKSKNIKADFMGLTSEINGVPHGGLLSLSEKWVITISSQYGCSMNCTFCDVPIVGRGKNVTEQDLIDQVMCGISLHPEIKTTKRLNVHYARMGEPTFNISVIAATEKLKNYLVDRLGWGFHPVVSTMCPKNNRHLVEFLREWVFTKSVLLDGEAGLQLSINTTDDTSREKMFSGNALSLCEISNLMNKVLEPFSNKHKLSGRKYTLNFALTGNKINAKILKKYFDPALFICKITPMHETKSCVSNNILSRDGYDHYYPYKKVESDLKNEGFDVIVFIPSHEEDESKITCGNAILAEYGKTK